MSEKVDLLLLFDRPNEPIFLKRGDNIAYSIPSEYLTERYAPIGRSLYKRIGEVSEYIHVKNVPPPDLTEILSISRKDEFSLGLPRHCRLSGKLIDIFMKAKNVEDLQSIAVYARDRVNPYLFQYALTVAVLHRPDTKEIMIPSYIEMFPHKFIDARVFSDIKEEIFVLQDEFSDQREPIVLPLNYTASDELEPENKLGYFREDPGINLHHYHWHLVYPFDASNRALVDKDRRGELFYYAHEQILARYNFERLANKLERAKPYGYNFKEPMTQGYFPKMDSLISSRGIPGRQENSLAKDIKREADLLVLTVKTIEDWRDRYLEAIEKGYVVTESEMRIPLESDENTDAGIDILGNMLEASSLTPNKPLYGSIHNYGHVFISYAHDPADKFLEPFGVMNDPSTAMRDPMFYRLHAFLDSMCQTYKVKLKPYSEKQLTFSDIQIMSVKIKCKPEEPNTLNTFWNHSDVDISRGLDFQPRGSFFVRFPHLNHEPFSYEIEVNNKSAQVRRGMCRIFMAPKYNESGSPFPYDEQRLMMAEMEKCLVELQPGVNVIRRRSVESTVTIPFEMTFRRLDKYRTVPQPFNMCGCGWPQHMLVPRGTKEGMECELFVMISDYELDKIDQNLTGVCSEAAAYCGIRDKKYPDLRPMGYPFDRSARDGVHSLNEFLTPNMMVQNVKIVFEDTFKRKPKEGKELSC